MFADFALGNCWFGSVKINKNANLDKYIYSGYGIGFDSPSEYSLPDGTIGKNVIIFGADMSSSVYIDNKEKDDFLLKDQHRVRWYYIKSRSYISF